MADTFVRLERVGNGYFMKPSTGRTDTVCYTDQFVVGTSVDFDTDVPYADTVAMVVGHDADGVDSRGVWMVQDTVTETWHVYAGVAGGAAAFVVVMFMNRALCGELTPITV
jgi:hypothetical protein